MPKYLLVAVTHEVSNGPADDLMDRTSRIRFETEILPLITEKSLVLCEGFDHPTLIQPAHRRYDMLHRTILGLPETVRPTIGGFDHRTSKIRSVQESIDAADRHDEYERLIKTIVDTDWQTIPTTYEEMMSALRAGVQQASIKRQPTPHEAELVRWLMAESLKFDRLYLEAMRKHGRRYDLCLFVGGAVHVVSMALKSQYPAVFLSDSGEIRDIFHSYLADYHWGRLILRAKQK